MVRNDDKSLIEELTSMLVGPFPGITVDAGISERWNRPSVTFIWEGFRSLLPEERFQRLTRAIPESYRTENMQGRIWLELAPDESIEDFLAFPRSEDVEPREGEIFRTLNRGGFFDLLAKAMGGNPERTCASDFAFALASIERSKGIGVSSDDVKLIFIRQGVYCDCQVLESARPALAEMYAGAA